MSVPFLANNEGEAVFSISGNAEWELAVSFDGENAMIPADPGADLTVTINPVDEAPQISFSSDFNGLPSGYQLLKYKIDSEPTNTIWSYDGSEMHYACINGDHYIMWIVEDTIDASAADLLITSTLGIPAANNGDINGDGKLQIVDAQIAYDMANGHANYNALTHLDISLRLKADVNGDGQVTVEDAQAIQYKLHNGSFPW